jgi:MoaA/NifB/PqqE/SkfB family radical SAM enzyme
MAMMLDSRINIRNVGWSIGSYCNANCAHCYSATLRRSSATLSKKEIDVILGKLSNSNVTAINIGGNEPLYTNGSDPSISLLPYVIRQAVSSGIAIGITTNGVTAHYLAEHDPELLCLVNDWDISLDSPFENEHNANRKSKIYRVAIDALARFSQLGVNCSIVMCAMNWNTTRKHAQYLIDLAIKYNTGIRINSLRPVSPAQFKYQPTPRQFYNFFSEIDKLADSLYIGEPVLNVLGKSPGMGCPCGINSMSIHPKKTTGQVPVTPCVFLANFEVSDLLTDTKFTIYFIIPEFSGSVKSFTKRVCRFKMRMVIYMQRGVCRESMA